MNFESRKKGHNYEYIPSPQLQNKLSFFQLTIRAEGVPDFVLRDGGEPDCGVELDLGGRDEYRVVAGVDRAEAPEGEPQAAIGIKAESHVPGGIQLALQLHRPVGIM